MSDDGAKATGTAPGVAAQIHELEAQLAVAKIELGNLKLQLDVMSTTDPITGLPNLHGLVELIEDATARRGRTGEPFGILAVRFRELETVIARCGAAIFKESARHIGAVIAAGLRQIDRVGRMDTTTFLAVLPALDPTGVPSLFARLQRMLLSVPLDVATEDDAAPIRLRPELSVVLSPPEGPTAAAYLLDRLFELRNSAEFGTPVIEVTRPVDEGVTIRIP